MPRGLEPIEAAVEAAAGPPRSVKVAIFARRRPDPEPQCDRVRAEALRRGHEVRDADVAAFVTGDVAVDVAAGTIFVGGVRVDDVDAVLLGPLPGPAARTSPAGASLLSDEHAALTTLQYERHLLAWSIVVELEARGVPVLSSPTRARPFDSKPAQLLALARAGLPVPATRIHTPGLGAHDDNDDDVVHKPIAGGPVRARARGSQLLIEQRRVRGSDLRVVVVGDAVVAAGRFPGDDDVIDLRERPAFVTGIGRWLPDDDDDAAGIALRAARICCCDFAAVDLKRSAAGVVTLLEVNRTPVVLDLEDDLGAPICARLLDLIEARAR